MYSIFLVSWLCLVGFLYWRFMSSIGDSKPLQFFTVLFLIAGVLLINWVKNEYKTITAYSGSGRVAGVMFVASILSFVAFFVIQTLSVVIKKSSGEDVSITTSQMVARILLAFLLLLLPALIATKYQGQRPRSNSSNQSSRSAVLEGWYVTGEYMYGQAYDDEQQFSQYSGIGKLEYISNWSLVNFRGYEGDVGQVFMADYSLYAQAFTKMQALVGMTANGNPFAKPGFLEAAATVSNAWHAVQSDADSLYKECVRAGWGCHSGFTHPDLP